MTDDTIRALLVMLVASALAIPAIAITRSSESRHRWTPLAVAGCFSFVAGAGILAAFPSWTFSMGLASDLRSAASRGDAAAGVFAGCGLVLLAASIALQAWELSENRRAQEAATLEAETGNRQARILGEIEAMKLQLDLEELSRSEDEVAGADFQRLRTYKVTQIESFETDDDHDIIFTITFSAAKPIHPDVSVRLAPHATTLVGSGSISSAIRPEMICSGSIRIFEKGVTPDEFSERHLFQASFDLVFPVHDRRYSISGNLIITCPLNSGAESETIIPFNVECRKHPDEQGWSYIKLVNEPSRTTLKVERPERDALVDPYDLFSRASELARMLRDDPIREHDLSPLDRSESPSASEPK